MADALHAQTGSFAIGGDLTVNRLGFGAMRITGDGIWGGPKDKGEALRTLKRIPELGLNFIDHRRQLRPVRQRGSDPGGPAPLQGPGDCHQRRPDPQRAEYLGAGRPSGIFAPVRDDERAQAGRGSASTCGNCTALTRKCRARSSFRSWPPCKRKA